MAVVRDSRAGFETTDPRWVGDAVNEAEKPILGALDGYRAAVFTKDAAAFVALYDRDVRVFDMWGECSYVGVEAWRGMAKDWFASLGAERVAVDVDGVQTIRDRLTWAPRRKDGAWKIVHEHTSAPVDFKTSKLIAHD
jgi:ketosteroid isomerase-like protein